jgi:hypothetical protein
MAVAPKMIGLGRDLYTIHSDKNTIYATRPDNPRLKVAVMSFKFEYDAMKISKMLEEYKLRTKTWPALIPENVIQLPFSDKHLRELNIRAWDIDDLSEYCMNNLLDLITIHSIGGEDGTRLNLSGASYTFDANVDYYKALFETKLPGDIEKTKLD